MSQFKSGFGLTPHLGSALILSTCSVLLVLLALNFRLVADRDAFARRARSGLEFGPKSRPQNSRWLAGLLQDPQLVCVVYSEAHGKPIFEHRRNECYEVRRLEFFIQEVQERIGGDALVFKVRPSSVATSEFFLLGIAQLSLSIGTGFFALRKEAATAARFKSIGELASETIHDLRTPLLGLKVAVQSGLDDGDRVEIVESSVKTVETALTRLKLLRAHASLSESNDSFREGSDFPRSTASVAQVVSTLEHVIGMKRCELPDLKVSLDGISVPTGLTASCVVEDLAVIISNLISNSWEAGARVVSVSIELAPSSKLKLIITDDGVGFGAKSPRKRPFAGLGHGLASAQRKLGGWGGRIDIPSSGSRVEIVLLTV